MKIRKRSEHWMTVRRDHHTGAATWTGYSSWDAPSNGNRIRQERTRRTWLPTEREAKRWAKRYGVELPLPATKELA